MGVLYWQMNDIWQGPSWSSMEYDGRWRVVQYAVQRAYAPLLISAYEKNHEEQTVHVHLTSDSVAAIEGHTLRAHLHRWAATDDTPLLSWSFTVDLPALGSKEVAAIDTTDFLSDNGPSSLPRRRPHEYGICSRDACFLRFELLDAHGQLAAEPSFHWLTTLGSAQLPAPTQKLEGVEITGDSTADVTVSSVSTSVFVLLETVGGPLWAGKFSQNAFTLLPGERRTVTFTARHGTQIDMTQLRQKLKLRSLADALLRDTARIHYV